jgi:ribonuclease HII
VATQWTADTGGQSPSPGSSEKPSQPTGLQTGSGSSRRKAAAKKAAALFAFDRSLGNNWVVGADEAGRGCLAGPLVAAAVAFDQSKLSIADLRRLEDLDDSKKRKGERRAALFEAIQQTAAVVTVSIKPAQVIDREGLHVSNKAALADAAARAGGPDAIHLTDGFEVDLPWGKSEKLIKGDSRSAAIAAASIIAKEARDRWMVLIAERYPGYYFDLHMGYATAEHREAIMRLGPCDLHRRSFNSSAFANAA